MQFPLLIAALVGDAVAIHAVAVTSQDPYACNAVSGVDIAWAEDENSIHADFPDISLTVYPPAHGNENGQSTVGCGAAVEFADWSSGQRFAVSNVTIRASNLNLPGDNDLYTIKASVDFQVVDLLNYYPIQYPLQLNYASSSLLDIDVDSGIGNGSFVGPYEQYVENAKTVWSPCFNGYLSNTTTMVFALSAETVKGGTSDAGWSMDLGIVWEDCYYPDQGVWGQTVLTNWESCSFSDNGTKRERC
ncbi:Uu.00g048930.m01.CDS01 [Anthostomella pinea]|uniref:Uu.00g048930.m01.CDS01 n=1 Tax=Anthostomella pinea TaxID=933095 RepID=A0AAI8VBU0_9PEZI|nr:Uu.00g048930.m01.CDS01 [Anthostomella pinea]